MSKCEHLNTLIETLDNEDDYMLGLAQGNPYPLYVKYDIEVCEDCDASRQLPEGDWQDED